MSVNVKIKSVFDEQGIKNAEKAFGGLSGTVKNFGGLLAGALGGVAVFNFANNAIKSASDIQESTNAVNVAFGKSAEAVLAVGANAASSLGLASTEFNEAAVRFSAFADRIVGAGGNTAGFIQDITTRAADFASVFNIEVSEALRVFQSGLAGEAEPLKRFGINLLESEVKAYALREGIISVGEQMSEQQKVQARYGLLMEATAKTAGDFANTSDGLANSQRILKATFTDLQGSLGTALLPAVEMVVAELKDLAPVLEDSLVRAINNIDFESLGETLSNLVVFVADNIDEFIAFASVLVQFAPAIATLTAAYAGLKTALGLAQVAQLLFNSAVIANPYVFGATAVVLGITAIVGAINLIKTAMGGTATETEKATNAAFNLNNVDLSRLDGRLFQLELRARGLAGVLESTTLIPASPTAGSKMPENPKPGQKYTFFNYSGPEGQAVWFEQTWTGTEWTKPQRMTYTPPGGSTQKEEKETTAQRFAKVQAVIKKAQKAIRDAESNYAGERFRIQQDYESNVLRLQTDAARQQLDLVNKSKARITDAFKAASRVSLTDLFDSTTTREIETTVKQLTSRLSVTVTRETEKTAFASVNTLVSGLRDRLNASKQLLQNASQLASEGFSQTFIEEVISAGTETGNALADAIISAAPETRAELKDLYDQLETVGETGAQALADDLYNTFGLATRGLRDQSVAVAQELKDSLEEQNKALGKSLADAGAAFGLAIRDIKDTFLSDLEQFDGWFAGLGRTIDQLLGKMGQLQGKALTDTQEALTASTAGTVLAGAAVTQDVSVQNIKNAQGLVIDSMQDVAGTAAYLEARIKAANTYIKSSSSNAAQELSAAAKIADFTQQLANLRGAAATGDAAGTVININVKTDTTQSRAMVGKTIGNIVTKYVTTGGQVLVSGNE